MEFIGFCDIQMVTPKINAEKFLLKFCRDPSLDFNKTHLYATNSMVLIIIIICCFLYPKVKWQPLSCDVFKEPVISCEGVSATALQDQQKGWLSFDIFPAVKTYRILAFEIYSRLCSIDVLACEQSVFIFLYRGK